MSLRIVAGTKW